MHTKYIDSQMSIYWREKSIHKAKEPPCDIECNCDGEEDYATT